MESKKSTLESSFRCLFRDGQKRGKSKEVFEFCPHLRPYYVLALELDKGMIIMAGSEKNIDSKTNLFNPEADPPGYQTLW